MIRVTKRLFSAGLAATLMAAAAPGTRADDKAPDLIPIRVGYVPNWNVQSNFVAVLRFTDVMQKLGLKPVFTPFLAGGPLNQAMLGGQLDIGLIGGGPAVSLVANGGKAKIIARISDVRDALIVKTDSPYKTVADLKGKTIASFVGSNTYMVLLSLLKGGGLDPKKDVNIINLSPDAHYNAVMKGDVAAYDTWDPYIELAQERGGVRILAQGRTAGPGVAVVSEDYLAKNREGVVRMLEAIATGIWYMGKNKDQVNTWLAEDTKMSKKVVERSSEVDRNYRAAPDLLKVSMDITPEDVKGLNEIVEYFGSLNQIKTRPEMSKYVDPAPLKEAFARLQKNPDRKVAVTKN
jgi:sulfonate transport system substrate-binding protein